MTGKVLDEVFMVMDIVNHSKDQLVFEVGS